MCVGKWHFNLVYGVGVVGVGGCGVSSTVSKPWLMALRSGGTTTHALVLSSSSSTHSLSPTVLPSSLPSSAFSPCAWTMTTYIRIFPSPSPSSLLALRVLDLRRYEDTTTHTLPSLSLSSTAILPPTASPSSSFSSCTFLTSYCRRRVPAFLQRPMSSGRPQQEW